MVENEDRLHTHQCADQDRQAMTMKIPRGVEVREQKDQADRRVDRGLLVDLDREAEKLILDRRLGLDQDLDRVPQAKSTPDRRKHLREVEQLIQTRKEFVLDQDQGQNQDRDHPRLQIN